MINIVNMVNIVDINYNMYFYFRMFLRFIYIMFWTSFYVIDYYYSNHVSQYMLSRNLYPRLDMIKNITHLLESINITYVKVFQSFCLDKDILTDNEKAYLIKYTDSVPFNTDEVDYTLINTIQEEFDIEIYYDQPINSGIVGIVFPGYYKKYNKKVVIKLLKKNIDKNLDTLFKEFKIISWFLKWIPYINILNIGKIIEDNKELLLSQLDFKKELENMKIFKQKNINFDFITIPEGYSEITEKYNNVIIMENIKGLTIREVKNMSTEIKEIFGELLMTIGLNSILFTGANHNDLHPGNIFFYINNEEESHIGLCKYRIGLIDFGICNFIEGLEQEAYYYFFYNILTLHEIHNREKNIECIKFFIEEKEIFESFSPENNEKFWNDITNWLKDNINKKQIDMGIKFLYEFISILNKWKLNVSKSFNKSCLSIQCMNTIGKELLENPLLTQNKITKELIDCYENINKLLEV